ncbi:MAG: regulator of cell autolysis [Pedobacter sp.]|nr:MAG: regulator of cell autolysis [Pedobacter sp.]
MKFRLLFLFCGLLFAYACKQDTSKQRSEIIATYSKAIDELANKVPAAINADSILNAWRKYNRDAVVLSDTNLNANVKYYLGRMYARKNADTAKMYLQQGLELVEQSKDYLPVKARIYSGMGNLAYSETLEHQANYYYNKAAMIVLADTTVKLGTMAKTIMLLSASQSNTNLQQYSLAYKMDLAALKLMPKLPPNSVNQQRVLVQLIVDIYKANLPDKDVEGYLKKLEKLQATYPKDFNPRFLYDCKLFYFDKHKNADSVLKYALINTKMDEKVYQQDQLEETITNNLYISYVNILINYTRLKNFAKAAIFKQKADEITKQHRKLLNYEDIIRGCEASSAYYAAIGQNNKALAAAKEAISLQKENFATENTQAIAEMNALYQIQAKDKSINTLNKDIKLNSLKLQRNQLILLIAALIVLLLLIFIFLFYSIYKQRKLKEEKEKVQLQQQLLRTQMEPHFIFNTLSALQSFIRLDEKDEAIKYLNQFSRLLRSSLELSREHLVPLSQEIETLENYLSLQQMRYNNIFKFNLQVPNEDLDTIMLPPMLIQPFVENSILHGINLGDTAGFINVDFVLIDQILKVEITDSGKDLADNKPQNHQSLSGIISKERLQLLGKERNQTAGITYTKNKNGGTMVTLLIPTSPIE